MLEWAYPPLRRIGSAVFGATFNLVIFGILKDGKSSNQQFSINGSQLAKMKISIPDMSWTL